MHTHPFSPPLAALLGLGLFVTPLVASRVAGAPLAVIVLTTEGTREEAVRDDIRETLRADPRVTSGDVAIVVDDGVVTLFGTVDDDGERAAAVELVRGTAGVRRVRDRLRVDRAGGDEAKAPDGQVSAADVSSGPLDTI